ncbi:MAG TPA: EAL domain-containing protein [Aromatoleum sp.]|uniref:EAL domain-containing protein n=1 Tax=Aromatoleum sp. TaxID=2307007 RepID=UPI002B4787D7|nr:EAL domain-containing protein [Aromatoleum sp.]HJV26230.1 EAL domain-containing protein [Aromatoleum sp.]
MLVLDDDETMREIVTELLHRLGITDVLTAANGHEGIALMDTARPVPNLLVCDLNMPGMDGIELLRTIAGRGYEGYVVLLSGASSSILKAAERLAIELGLGFLGVLEKPVTERQLANVLVRSRRSASIGPRGSPDMLTPDEIRAGIEQGQITLVFQPKVSVADQRVVGVECLSRWRHPERGILPPATFIPVMEQHGLIDSFTLEVFRLAVAQLHTWREAGRRLKLSINLSMDSLRRLDLPEVLESMADAAGVAAHDLILEVTETRLLQDLKLSLDILLRMRLKGFDLSIDDFGTGYSTMESLKDLPFTELKIDRAFVHDAANDPAALAILRSSAALGHTLGLSIVAEGVETDDDWAVVAAAGCEEVQGYVVAKPMGADELPNWIDAWEGRFRGQARTTRIPSVFVIDDQEGSRARLVSALGRSYRVNSASSGEEALLLIPRERPDVVLLDLAKPPGIDGYETCRQLKSRRDTASIPVVFISCEGDIERRLEGYDSGGEDYIVKPFDIRELEAKLGRLLARAYPAG